MDTAAADFDAVAEQVAEVRNMRLETSLTERSCHDGRAADVFKLAAVDGGDAHALFQVETGSSQMTESTLAE